MANDLIAWATIIENEGRRIRKNMRWLENRQCLRCCVYPPVLVSVGPMAFCSRCARSQFGNTIKFEPNSLEYKLWLEEYWRQQE